MRYDTTTLNCEEPLTGDRLSRAVLFLRSAGGMPTMTAKAAAPEAIVAWLDGLASARMGGSDFPADGGVPSLFDEGEPVEQRPILRPGELSSTPRVTLARDVTRISGPVLEVDRGGPRGQQSARVIEATLDQYRRFWEGRLVAMPVFPRVLFVASQPRRVAQLRAIVDRQPDHVRPLFAVAGLDEAAAVLSGQSTDVAGLDTLRLCAGGLYRQLVRRAQFR